MNTAARGQIICFIGACIRVRCTADSVYTRAAHEAWGVSISLRHGVCINCAQHNIIVAYILVQHLFLVT